MGSPHHSADRLIGQLALLRVEPVDEQHPVEMIRLVLHAAGQLPRALDGDRFAIHVEALGHRAEGAQRREGQAGEGQAALVVGLGLVRQVQRRVDQVPQLVVHVVGEDPEAHPNLRRGQAKARRVQHRVGEVLDQLAQLGIEVADRLGRGAQHRVAEDADRLDADGAPSFCSVPSLRKVTWGVT
jgi:hypothetical protein